MDDLYAVLGVSKDADDKELKKAYRSLCQKHHPDKETGNEETFKAIKYAYEVLSDPVKRKNYDETGSPENEELNNAYEVISKLYARAARDCNYEPKNYLVEVVMNVQNNMRECLSDKKKIELAKERIGYLIKNTKGDEFINMALEADLARLQEQELQAESALKVIKLALDILDKVSYTGQDITLKVRPTGSSGPFQAPWGNEPYVGA